MHPILFTIAGQSIYTYGVLMALAILVGVFWIGKRAEKSGYSGDSAATITIAIAIAGIGGARLLYLVYFPEMLANPLNILTERGGLVWYGGLIASCLTALVLLRFYKLPTMRFADWAMPPVLLGLFLGRLGCFMSGCCYGAPCHLPWAVQFPVGHLTHPAFVHPTQLYEALGALLLMGLILVLERQNKLLRPGVSFSIFLIGYGFLRFAIEYLRADAYSVGLFSASQWMSLLSVAIGVALVFLPKKQVIQNN